ncbi:MAG: M28 family peptidase [Ktedonobacteraceae bacterium]
MTTSTPTSTHTTGGTPTPTTKSSGVSVSSLFKKVGPRLLLLLVMVLSAWLAIAQFTPPTVVPKDSPATEFSAERAMTYLPAIAKEPHPMGSPASEEVRTYLVQQIRSLGLTPEVQTTTVVQHWPGDDEFRTGTVQNVIVRLKGTASTRAILLDAHYDSAASGPGASDNGAAVVTLLETMRGLTAGPPLKNDIIFMFADGEERGDLGAHAFATQHPWMQEVGLAINFEAMGTQGATEIFDSSPQDGWLTTEFLKAAPYPLGNSSIVNLFKAVSATQMGMDLQEYLDRGSAGLDFVYTDDLPAYHTMRDNVQLIDARSIQHDGSYALSLVRHFGSMDLSQIPKAPDEVYFNIMPGVVVHYSSTWALPLAGLVILLFLGLIVLGFRRKHLKAGRFSLGVFTFPVSLIVTLVIVLLAWWALKALNPNYQVFMAGIYGLDLLVLGLAALVIGLISACFLWLSRRIGLYNLATGAMVWWAMLLVVSSLFYPTGSFLFTWPLLFSTLGLGWLFFTRDSTAHPWLRATVLAVASVPGIVLLTPLVIYLVPLMSYIEAQAPLPLTAVPLVFVALLMGLLIPQLGLIAGELDTSSTRSRLSPSTGRRFGTRLQRWLVPISALLVSIMLLLAAIATSGFSATHPGTDSVTYQLNADNGQAVWLSNDRNLDDWTRQFFPTSTGPGPFSAQAPTVALTAPDVILKNDTTNGNIRTLRMQVVSPRHAEDAMVQVETQGEIVTATVDSKPFDLSVLPESAPHRLKFAYYALPDKGFELTLSITSMTPVKITVQDISNGLPTIPGLMIRPRPVNLMPALNPTWLDPTIVSKSFTFAR